MKGLSVTNNRRPNSQESAMKAKNKQIKEIEHESEFESAGLECKVCTVADHWNIEFKRYW